MEKQKIIISKKDRRELKYRRIKDLHRLGYSMADICLIENVSKTTVFFALKGRAGNRKRLVAKRLKSIIK